MDWIVTNIVAKHPSVRIHRNVRKLKFAHTETSVPRKVRVETSYSELCQIETSYARSGVQGRDFDKGSYCRPLMFSRVMEIGVKIIIGITLFPKYSSLYPSTVNADDGNVEKIKGVIAFSCPGELNNHMGVMKRFNESKSERFNPRSDSRS